MALDQQYRYVNGARNIVWLTGFLRKIDNQYFVQQNNNMEQMIPLVVSKDFILPSEFTPIEATCHVFGQRKDDEQQCELRVIQIKRPNSRSMPVFVTWLRGIKSSDNENEFKPFMSAKELREEFKEQVDDGEEITDSEKALTEWFKSTNGRVDSRLGENANKIFLAGYVGATRYVEPNEYQTNGYGEILLHQHREPEKCIPVRLYNPQAKQILRSLKKGMPVAFAGQVRMKVLPNDEGVVRSRNLHVRVDDVLASDHTKDFIGGVPSWWMDLFKEGQSAKTNVEEERKKLAAEKAQKAPSVKNDSVLEDM